MEKVAACILALRHSNRNALGLDSGNCGFTVIPVLVQLPPYLVIIG